MKILGFFKNLFSRRTAKKSTLKTKPKDDKQIKPKDDKQIKPKDDKQIKPKDDKQTEQQELDLESLLKCVREEGLPPRVAAYVRAAREDDWGGIDAVRAIRNNAAKWFANQNKSLDKQLAEAIKDFESNMTTKLQVTWTEWLTEDSEKTKKEEDSEKTKKEKNSEKTKKEKNSEKTKKEKNSKKTKKEKNSEKAKKEKNSEKAKKEKWPEPKLAALAEKTVCLTPGEKKDLPDRLKKWWDHALSKSPQMEKWKIHWWNAEETEFIDVYAFCHQEPDKFEEVTLAEIEKIKK